MEDPVKPDDADEKWEQYYGHTRAKHQLLRYYLGPWMRKLGPNFPKIRVFDCFAGRGEYDANSDTSPIELTEIETSTDIPGSPQIILDRAVEHSAISENIECVFIEKTGKNARILRDNLPARRTLPDNISYKVVEGRFQDVTKEQVKKSGGWNLPAFFFIDPYGYSQIEYDLITDLSCRSGHEILINLMASEVIRWQDVDKHQDALKKPFGTDNWREELENYEPDHLEHREVGYYCERLQENGPNETLAYLVTEEDSTAMKYYLVFGTNKSDGLEIMREGMRSCGPGKFAYAPHREDIANDQSGLDQFYGNKVREKLLDLFSGETMPFDDLIKEYVVEEKRSAYRRKDIRSELKDMEDEDLIDVTRVTSKTERGLGGHDIISFPDE
ncbi:three-Cys-motif partner protein TcmP [Natrinema thermotolerans]|uniref:Three-Cys-motif partner protein TcmP n=1 Tax=Natrinema thermotolerans TaxID=121872 RepID=A0AAF0PBB4_9EURY|nr:three-Cys-motif partner protein TcmP [Natrinema thermotolerans]QCC57857.1 three-Cys-motif partner protein TcmP [Natrinema thermotolerans]WMT08948.1 three-Cys-motif partner protein TcmP [Natrinema thermotolerans]